MMFTLEESKQILTKEFLVIEHIDKEQTPKEISLKTGFSTGQVYEAFARNKVQIIDWYSEKIDRVLTEKYLIEEYANKKLLKIEISKNTGFKVDAITSRLKRYGIHVRGVSETLTGRKRSKEHIENWAKANRGVSRKFKNPEERNRKLSKALKGRPKHFKNPLEKQKKYLKSIQATPNLFEIRCLNYLNYFYPNKFKYCGDGSCDAGNLSADAYSVGLNIAVLFHGTYWHCNPKYYKADYIHPHIKKTAKEIWDKNKRIHEELEKAGYKVMVLWEDKINNWFKLTLKKEN